MDSDNPSNPLKQLFSLQYDRSITDFSSYTNVILIDRRVIQSNIFFTSCNSTTFPIIYNFSSSSYEVQELLAKFNKNIRLAFVFEHTIGAVNMLFDNTLIFNNNLDNNNVSSVLQLISTLNITNIDYLACNTMNDSVWEPYYNLLRSCNVVIGCSSNFTGNMVGDDWNMESTGENIKNLYFTDNINYYTSHLGNGNTYPNTTISNAILYISNNNNGELQYTIDENNTNISGNIMLSDCSLNLSNNINISNTYCFGVTNNVYFDGHGFKITFSVDSSYNGLFDMIDANSKITIKNLTFDNNNTVLNNSAFLIQKYAQGTINITNCDYNGNIDSNDTNNSAFIGANAGYQSSICTANFTDCSSGNVSGNNSYNSAFIGAYAGNYGGTCNAVFNRCTASNVSGNNSYNSAFIGYNLGNCTATFTDCSSSNVSGESAYNSAFVGCQAGCYWATCNISFNSCTASSVIGGSARNSAFVGSKLGFTNGTCTINFNNCTANNVNGNSARNSAFVGSDASLLNGNCTINFNNCITGNVSGYAGASNSAYIGSAAGHLGQCYIELLNCNGSDVDGEYFNSLFVGTEAGQNGYCVIKILNCYAGNVSGNTNAGNNDDGGSYQGNTAFVGNAAGQGFPWTNESTQTGYCDIYIINSYIGNVSGLQNTNSGFIGRYSGKSANGYTGNAKVTIINCYTGLISNGNSSFISSLETTCTGIINNCYTIGSGIGNMSDTNFTDVSNSIEWNDNIATQYLISDISSLLLKAPADISSHIYDISNTICPLPSPYNNRMWINDLSNTPWLLPSFNSAKYNNPNPKHPTYIISTNDLSFNIINNISYNRIQLINLSNSNLYSEDSFTNPYTIQNINSNTKFFSILSNDMNRYSVNLLTVNKIGGATSGDPLITTIYNTTYYLPHNDGLYLLFDNKNDNDSFKVIAECLKLTEKEIEESAFHNFLLDNTTFMTKLYIHMNNDTIEFDMNTLKSKNNKSKNIVLGTVYEDKNVFEKHYSDNKIKRFNVKFNGKSINIKVKGETLEYNLKASVDLGCADHRNEVFINGPSLSTGYGAIVSEKHKSLLLQYNV
jgi:hypothetical protein